LVTEHNSVSVFVEETVARQCIEDWTKYEHETSDASADAEEIGQTFYDRQGSLVQRIEGWYAPDTGDSEPVGESEFKKAVIAYRLRNVEGMSAQELP
jgi:hypothetical protein